jgi:Na+/melibiose symporter-like transporter
VSEKDGKLSLLQVFGSVISSFIGVQKNATRERDFRHGRARDFIIVGVVLTVLFILAVWGVVQLVMRVAVPG